MSTLPVPLNLLRRKLSEGGLCVGTMAVEFRQASVMTLLAQGGLDFVILDNEHGPFSIETLADLSRAARAVGITPIVRVPELSYAHVVQPLDAGAQGIMLPRVTERTEVEQVVRWMKYPPDGRRGAVLGRGHTDFAGGPLADTLAALNRASFLVVQIETAEAVERLEAILSVPGVDAALVGPTDLSLALGVPGQLEDPVLVRAIESVIAACQKHGVIPAIHTNDVRLTASWARRGMRMVSINSEAGLLVGGVRSAVATIRG